MNTHEIKEIQAFSLSVLDFYTTNTDISDLFSVQLVTGSSDEEEDTGDEDNEGGDNSNMATSVSKGEKYPIAVQVLPVDNNYSEFVINANDTYVEVQNNTGKSIEVHGEMSVDAANKTVLFSWDTSKYSLGSYTIVFWISITYNETTFLMKSETISKSIRKSSLIS